MVGHSRKNMPALKQKVAKIKFFICKQQVQLQIYDYIKC